MFLGRTTRLFHATFLLTAGSEERRIEIMLDRSAHDGITVWNMLRQPTFESRISDAHNTVVNAEFHRVATLAA